MPTNVDLNLAADEILRLQDWPHLPYRQYHQTKDACASAYLSQFRGICRDRLTADGSLQISSNGDCLVGLRHIPGESSALGQQMARLEPLVFQNPVFEKAAINAAASFVLQVLQSAENIQHVSAPVPSADTFAQRVLQECGFKLADTIMCHHIDLEKLVDTESDGAIREATAEDADAVAQIAYKNFSNRNLSLNRFLCDPSFDPELVGRMYANWTRAAILEKDCDANLVFDDGEIAGFYTFRLPHGRGSDSQIGLAMAVLSAVDSAHKRKGIFARLQKAGCLWLKERGAKLVEVKTVLPNKPVNTVCQKMASEVVLTYHTFHWSK